MDALLDKFEQFVGKQKISFLPENWREGVLAYNEAYEEQSKRDCALFLQALKRLAGVTFFKVDEKTNMFERDFNPLNESARKLYAEHVE